LTQVQSNPDYGPALVAGERMLGWLG